MFFNQENFIEYFNTISYSYNIYSFVKITFSSITMDVPIFNRYKKIVKEITKINVMFVWQFVYTCPPSFSLATRVSTSGTTEPACLTGGSSTLITLILDARSTPRSLAVNFFNGFFFAFWKI